MPQVAPLGVDPHVSQTNAVQAPPLRILIVDDDAFYRRGIREILNEADGMRVVGEALDGEQALQLARQLRPDGLDVVLMDMEMPGLDGISATERLTAHDPSLPVVLLSQSVGEHDLFESVRVGATGYLSKGLAPEALVRSLRAFHRGESVPLSREMAQKILTCFRELTTREPTAPSAAAANLTRREQEVFELIGRGLRDRDIAAQLVVSESTVKKHVQNILRKLRARNRAEAIARLRGAGH